MDGYMKWNCFDLAEQMEVFEKCKREFRDLREDLLCLARDAEVMNSAESEPVRKLLNSVDEIVDRLTIEQNYLDKGIDIYYSAETQAKMQVETLRTSIGGVALAVTNAATSTGSAVMEDWLAAMVFRQSNDIMGVPG